MSKDTKDDKPSPQPSPTAPTSSMWGKKGRGYPELAKGGKK